MGTAFYLMRLASLSHFEASKILQNPHQFKKSSKAALQFCASCASLPLCTTVIFWPHPSPPIHNYVIYGQPLMKEAPKAGGCARYLMTDLFLFLQTAESI